MNAYEKFFSAVLEKKAPTTLLPMPVEWAIAEQCRLTERSKFKRTLGKRIFYIAFALQLPMIVIVAIASRDNNKKLDFLQVLPAICVYSLMIIATLIYVSHGWAAKRYKNKKPATLGCSLFSFAERFVVLMDAFGEKSERMAGWDLDRIEEFAKAVLRTQAQTIKQIQKDSSGNPIADIPAKQEFRRLFDVFAEWKLVSGPWDPYFA